MDAEGSQEHGREGVTMFKRWLESTTYLELNFVVYEKPRLCLIHLLNGQKKMDLRGQFIGPRQTEVVVECKRVSSHSNQGPAFERFLAEAYSNTVWEVQNGGDLAWIHR